MNQTTLLASPQPAQPARRIDNIESEIAQHLGELHLAVQRVKNVFSPVTNPENTDKEEKPGEPTSATQFDAIASRVLISLAKLTKELHDVCDRAVI